MKRKRKHSVTAEPRPGLEQLCDLIADCAQRTKTERCRQNGGPIDIPAMLVFRLDTEDRIGMWPIKGNPIDDFSILWRQALQLGNPDFVGFVSEGYTGPSRDNWQRGDLATEFMLGPCSGVKEALLIAGVDTRRGCHRNTSISFQYDQHDLPQFNTFAWRSIAQGNVCDLLSDCAREVRYRANP